MEWKTKIQQSPVQNIFEIFFFRKVGDGTFETLSLNDDIATINTVKMGDEIKPTIKLNGMMFESLIDAVHKDFKPSEGKFTEGKLEATEKHLEDMRKLLKLK